MTNKWLAKGRLQLALMASLSVFLVTGRSASAQLISNMQFNEAVSAQYSNPPTMVGRAQPVVSMTLPIQQTASANDLNGGTITASYTVTDNGSVAVISYNTSGSITEYNYIREGRGRLREVQRRLS